ncbi:MAG: hypothetical protein QM526_00820 [Alphaproteobacteria bacterium]|nr:hypothetical protein [Alphaproteobacteria bacterium]
MSESIEKYLRSFFFIAVVFGIWWYVYKNARTTLPIFANVFTVQSNANVGVLSIVSKYGALQNVTFTGVSGDRVTDIAWDQKKRYGFKNVQYKAKQPIQRGRINPFYQAPVAPVQ